MAEKAMTIHLKIWRQPAQGEPGRMESYTVNDVNPHMSFLEMLDVLNESLILAGKDPVAFESDCREGICGSCSLVINGQPHGPELGSATCQLHMRKFKDGDTITIEPWRAKPFPIIKDLVTDRSAMDRIIASGGYVSVRSGPKPDGNATPVPKDQAERAMDAAACIGCGACVAACPNASISLFTGAKITQLASLPQGQPERLMRVARMVEQMDKEGFGNCTNIGDCRSACPKDISLEVIRQMKADYAKALFSQRMV